MSIGIFTTCTRPQERGDLWDESIACYKDFADEVYVHDKEWPKEFSWEYIGQTFQEAYNQIDTDWVIRMDLDCLLHENDFSAIRRALELYSDNHAITFYKKQFILPDRYNVKSRLLLAVNKRRYGERLRFDGGGDLCQVSVDGFYLEPGHMYVPSVKIPVWNYECLLKTKEQLLEDKGRFARAWQRRFGEYKLGGPDDQSAYDKWLEMMLGRWHKPQMQIKLKDHPKYIQETIKNLKPENWGYNGFNLVEGKVYG